jgi:hypothetical protein
MICIHFTYYVSKTILKKNNSKLTLYGKVNKNELLTRISNKKHTFSLLSLTKVTFERLIGVRVWWSLNAGSAACFTSLWVTIICIYYVLISVFNAD